MSRQQMILNAMREGELLGIDEFMSIAACTHTQAKSAAAKMCALGWIVAVQSGYGHRKALYAITPAGLRQVSVDSLPCVEAAMQSRSALQSVWRPAA